MEASGRVYLDVHYMQRKLAKMCGCRWDAERRAWYSEPSNRRHGQALRAFRPLACS